jgi:hypothetical protein
MRFFRFSVALLSIGCGAPPAAQPAPQPICILVTSPGEIQHGSLLSDFEDRPLGPTASPLMIREASFSAGPGLGIADVSQWKANGTFVTHNALIPFSAGTFPSGGYSPMTLHFDPPVHGVGLGWFDPNEQGNRFEALDTEGRVITSGAPTLGPTGGSHAAFIGVAGPACAIASVRIVPGSAGDWYAIDNVVVAR